MTCVASHEHKDYMRIEIKGITVDKAVRILRRRLDNDNRKNRLRELEYYEKPTAKRKRMKDAAVKRQEKLHREHTKFLTRKPLRRR